MRSVERIPGSCRESSTDDIRQRLRDLPTERQAPYDWTEFRRRERKRSWPKRSPVKWEHAAVAAGVTALVASMAMWGRADHQGVLASGVTAPMVASNQPATQAPPVAGDEGSPANEADSSAWTDELNERFNTAAQDRADAASLAAQAAVAAQLAAFARGQGSKRWLARHHAEPAIVRVGPRLAVANLEDRIAWVDDALTDAQFASVNSVRMEALEQERARLVSSLAQVRYAETLAAQIP
jgi:hypothetical protein